MHNSDTSDDGSRAYIPANRTSRRAAKAAKQLQIQEQQQEQAAQEQVALQLRFAELEAANAKLLKTIKNKTYNGNKVSNCFSSPSRRTNRDIKSL